MAFGGLADASAVPVYALPAGGGAHRDPVGGAVRTAVAAGDSSVSTSAVEIAPASDCLRPALVRPQAVGTKAWTVTWSLWQGGGRCPPDPPPRGPLPPGRGRLLAECRRRHGHPRAGPPWSSSPAAAPACGAHRAGAEVRRAPPDGFRPRVRGGCTRRRGPRRRPHPLDRGAVHAVDAGVRAVEVDADDGASRRGAWRRRRPARRPGR